MNQSTFAAVGVMTIFAAVSLGCSVPAVAADSASAVPPLSYAVRFQDLDLSRMEAVTTLYSRLTHAARALCEPPRRPGMMVSAERSAEAAACVDKAVDEAVTRINRPLVTQYRRSRATDDARRARLAQTR